MNRRLVSVFTFAVVVASLTSFLIYRLIVSHVQSPGHEPVVSNKVVVAAHDLQVGALLHDFDVKDVAWTDSLPVQAITKSQDVVGRGVIATIYQNEPILNTRLAAKGAGAGLAATIPIGRRAVALRVDAGVAAILEARPGDDEVTGGVQGHGGLDLAVGGVGVDAELAALGHPGGAVAPAVDAVAETAAGEPATDEEILADVCEPADPGTRPTSVTETLAASALLPEVALAPEVSTPQARPAAAAWPS